jgi:hypothetical protein
LNWRTPRRSSNRGIDNLGRPGSERNRQAIKVDGVRPSHGDIQSQSDLDVFPTVDSVINATANPNVFAGVSD